MQFFLGEFYAIAGGSGGLSDREERERARLCTFVDVGCIRSSLSLHRDCLSLGRESDGSADGKVTAMPEEEADCLTGRDE